MPQLRTLSVHFLPALVEQRALAGQTVIVIDLLRASTTVAAALAAGALEVRPFTEVDFVREAAHRFPREQILLGGERHGRRLEGFDLGNSPAEYTPDVVAGKRILFSTTNGTWALQHAREASRTVMACLWNLSAVAHAVSQDEHVHILCAGTRGEPSRDDLIAAGAYVDSLLAIDPERVTNEPADEVVNQWRELVTRATDEQRPLTDVVADELRLTTGGRDLVDIGHDHDVVLCAGIDRVSVVPELDRATNSLRS